MWFLRSLVFLLAAIAFLWIGMNNADQRVDFRLFTKVYPSLSLNLLLLVVFLAGMVLSFLIAALGEFQLRRRLSRQRREIGRLERELADLRSLPLDDAALGPPADAGDAPDAG